MGNLIKMLLAYVVADNYEVTATSYSCHELFQEYPPEEWVMESHVETLYIGTDKIKAIAVANSHSWDSDEYNRKVEMQSWRDGEKVGKVETLVEDHHHPKS